MRRRRKIKFAAFTNLSMAVELLGLGLVCVGIVQVSEPAAMIFAGGALVFIAQGMEGGE